MTVEITGITDGNGNTVTTAVSTVYNIDHGRNDVYMRLVIDGVESDIYIPTATWDLMTSKVAELVMEAEYLYW